MTIRDFLEARISEDELAATEGISGQADPASGWGYKDHALTPHVGIIHEAVQAEHIIRWHPARVLAECAAKRAIIDEHSTQEVASLDRETWAQPFIVCKRCAMGVRQIVAPCPTIKAIAAIYADHPDYKDEWKV